MSRYNFCPRCGSKTEPEEGGSARCETCDRSWHDNPSPTVGAVLLDGNRALITQRATQPDMGRWDVPGGFLDPGEDPIDGLKRELKEELGVEIESSIEHCIDMAAAPYGSGGDYVLALGFAATLVSGEPTPADDVGDFRWVTESELDEVDFAWEHDRRLVSKALQRGT